MESDFSRAVTEELNCSICLSYLIDPVTISCGHSFCQACLHLFWEDSLFLGHCPTCRKRTKQKDFRTNIVLKKLVSIAKQSCLMKYLISEENKCVIHKEIKGIHISKEVKFSLFAENMILYISDHKNSTKTLLQLINTFQ